MKTTHEFPKHIVYIRLLTQDELYTHHEVEPSYGVFDSNGEILVACDDEAEAFEVSAKEKAIVVTLN